MPDKHIPKRSLGQNFLIDAHAAERIVDAADIRPGDTVVEIGPGRGALTRMLAGRSDRLVAIELDDKLCASLAEEFAARDNVEVVHMDALKYELGGLTPPVKVVANLPYNISTPIIRRLIDARGVIHSMVLMLQKEVAKRVAASPGGKEYGFLSVIVQAYADAEILFTLPPGAFKPAPKVDSAVVRITIHGETVHDIPDQMFFTSVVSAAFGQRRKTLRNSLKSGGGFLPTEDSPIDLTRRAETLSVREFTELAEFLFALKTN
jgi:16S rRNA (adenine1518-N6/adenine1519-N6)-dimethyltransferase